MAKTTLSPAQLSSPVSFTTEPGDKHVSHPQDQKKIQTTLPSPPLTAPSSPSTSTPIPTTLDPFHTLIQTIKQYFETLPTTKPALSFQDIDVEYLISLMDGYTSNPADWGRYAYSDPSKHYTRNCVVDLDGRANLLMLVWNPNKSSPVHDHARAHCVMKVLQGTLKEEVFSIPSFSVASDTTTSTWTNTKQYRQQQEIEPLHPLKETTYTPNEVTYICDDIGLHRISNPAEGDELAVSLHLYTPPNAADFGYCIYEEKTGKRSFVRMNV